ncbi:unnamed protein product [Diabrotica balteata]|uniref:Uncharacterized protein n=1 Tax=Diabrotica balteata TaxID=107213 RepID=A0A9N9XIS1_DIABA|nr:unnamed protein product [Diabrotica balteata]
MYRFRKRKRNRTCTENGTWYVNSSTHEPWGDYTACSEGRIATIFTNITSESDLWKRYETLVPILKIVSQTGYAVSLLSLIAAFIIMLSIKKLHCARNILHMNLFASFIFRALFHILKEILFVEGVGLQIDFSEKNGDLYFKTDIEQNNYQCKLLTSLVQFFTTANYSWILMEGLYLNNLIWRALFVDSSRNLVYYICLGWGLPIFVIIPWIIARIFLDDTMCWTTNDNVKAYLIIVIPTIIAVLINFALFIIISIVLYTKLRSPICEDTKRYQKWARSTLVLVPLFGVHYAVLLIFYFTGKTDIWLICDSLFGSFQGLFVAILYCFMNGEVKTELKPHIYNFLSYLATHPVLGICFPCRAKFLRSAVGRRSVCTTLSYSSIYVNGVGHRNSKSKFNEKGRHPNQEKNHCCNGKHPSIKNGVQVGIKHVGDGQLCYCLPTFISYLFILLLEMAGNNSWRQKKFNLSVMTEDEIQERMDSVETDSSGDYSSDDPDIDPDYEQDEIAPDDMITECIREMQAGETSDYFIQNVNMSLNISDIQTPAASSTMLTAVQIEADECVESLKKEEAGPSRCIKAIPSTSVADGKRKRKEEDSQEVETDDGEESLQVLQQSIDGSENEVGTTAQSQSKSNSINIVKSSGRKSMATNLPIVNEAVNLMRSISTKRAEKDEFSLFGEQVAMKLRKIVSAFARFSVQNIINTVLFEAEMGKYDNPHFINHSHPSTPQAYPLQSFNVAHNSIPSPGHYPNTLSGRSSTSTSTINQDEDIHTLLLQ